MPTHPSLVHLGRMVRLGVDDFLAEWRYARTRAVLMVAALWTVWAMALGLFMVSSRPVESLRADLRREDPTRLQWRDRRAWDGRAPVTASADRWTSGDPCAPAYLAQWRATGGWHPACLAGLPDGSHRTGRVSDADSLLVVTARVEADAMAARHERVATASLESTSRVPRLLHRIRWIEGRVQDIRRLGEACVALAALLLLVSLASIAHRRDATVALREVLGQRSLDTAWSSGVELGCWTALGSGVPLLMGTVLGLPMAMPVALVFGGFAIALLVLAGLRRRRRRGFSLAARLSLGAD